MKIISDFHDYYDIGMQNGVDPQLPYLRFRREEPVEFPQTGDWRKDFVSLFWYSRYYCFFYIGFAGKVWSCMDFAPNVGKPSLCYELHLIDDSFFIESFDKRYRWRKRYRPGSWHDRELMKQIKGEVAKCFESNQKPELLDLFEKFKTAIFVYKLGSKTVVINERLNFSSS